MKSKEFIRGTIRTIVLKMLSEGDRMYGYEITQKVADRTNGQITLTYGALYPVLYKLEGEGLLTTSTEIVDNRARKYYSLTSNGKKIAIAKVTELQKFVDMLQLLLTPKASANLLLQWS